MSKTFGNFPVTIVPEGALDERGMVTVRTRTVDRAGTADLAKLTGGEVEVRRNQRKQHGLVITETELLRAGISKDDIGVERWSSESGEASRPLIDHPEIVSLLQVYGAYYENGELTFPEVLPKPRRIGTSRSPATTNISPLAGRKSFDDASRTVRKLVVLPGEEAYKEYSLDGLIFEALPTEAPAIAPPPGHVWRCFVSTNELARAATKAAGQARPDTLVEVTVEYRSGYYPRELYAPWYAS